MCKHHWLLGMTTPTGTPACCKLCKKKRWFRARDCFGASKEKQSPIHISRGESPYAQAPFSTRGSGL